MTLYAPANVHLLHYCILPLFVFEVKYLSVVSSPFLLTDSYIIREFFLEHFLLCCGVNA